MQDATRNGAPELSDAVRASDSLAPRSGERARERGSFACYRPLRLAWTLALPCLLAASCASDHRRGAATRTVESFDPALSGGLVRRETWSDTERGGGIFLLTDPSAVNLVAVHTNQSALGGGSLFTAGSLDVRVDSNAAPIIGAAGTAAGNVIGATVKSAVK